VLLWCFDAVRFPPERTWSCCHDEPIQAGAYKRGGVDAQRDEE